MSADKFTFLEERSKHRIPNKATMPCDYSIDAKLRLVTTVLSGVVTLDECLDHQKRLMKDAGFSPEFNQVIDGTRVTHIEFHSVEFREVTKISPFSKNARRAILVNSAFQYGMARMLQTYRDIAGGEEQFRIFEDRDEMMIWLLKD